MILFIDNSDTGDEDVFARKTAAKLSGAGFDVAQACSGKQGIEMADEICPDVVVVRDSASRQNGFDFCQQARNLYGLPLILLGDAPETEMYSSVPGKAKNWDYYMSYPVNYAELAARINILLWRYGKAGKPGARKEAEKR